MGDTPSNPSTDLAKSYGSNWTKTNVQTLFEWLAIAAYNIKALELSILYYRGILRRSTIYGLFVSTLSGTLSVADYNLTSGSMTSNVFKYAFTALTFTIAIFTAYLKVYQIQEQLEHFIKMKQDWIVFSTVIASELQLPTELRRDALFIIMKHKNTYLDLLKVDVEIMSSIKTKAMAEITFPKELNMHVSTLPEIILDIGTQEYHDFTTSSARAKDRFTSPTKNAAIAATMAALMKETGMTSKQTSPVESNTIVQMATKVAQAATTFAVSGGVDAAAAAAAAAKAIADPSDAGAAVAAVAAVAAAAHVPVTLVTDAAASSTRLPPVEPPPSPSSITLSVQ